MKSSSKVIQIKNSSTANMFLALGWELVETCTKAFIDPDTGEVNKYGDQYIVYCLAWPRDLGEAEFPNGPYNPDGIGN